MLATLLHEEAAILHDFVALLEREQSLLLDGETDALLDMAGQKTRMYRRLQYLSDERSRLFAGARQQPSEAAIRQLLSAHTTALADWENVVRLARQAGEQNQINGRLIGERMQTNQQALAVLMAAAAQPGATYGPDGQSRPYLAGRRFGSV
ncbi:MAG: flagellar protein FlgN [Rhodocyclaceae bacterium]|nr:flagellar protein FlgN [Rhodocyclaceae bacterium]